eukprot:m.66552 g.66552  ORF g.66552 m.66552 type:complete len:68 (-) comp18092_c0_seq1:461-664(-)
MVQKKSGLESLSRKSENNSAKSETCHTDAGRAQTKGKVAATSVKDYNGGAPLLSHARSQAIQPPCLT